MKVLKIGHRGVASYAPENTLASIRKALELGVDMVELDVRFCKTGEVVVIHNKKVNRTTNGRGLVSEKTLTELKELKINKTEKIPTLAEVLNLINRKCKVNIELKGAGTPEPISKIVKAYVKNGWSYNDFLVSSYNFSMLEEIRKINPRIQIGLLMEKAPKEIIGLARELKAYSINPRLKYITKKFVDDAHKGGLKVFVYTVNKLKDIEKMKGMGVDGIISDFPDRI
ncbi:MAG: glycerophosphodiester phosphodiesterase [Nanoarchaeota archaeon]|nr:glycerophosphodiester phosphodiesterase [Nanoarchaeota archaeon]